LDSFEGTGQLSNKGERMRIDANKNLRNSILLILIIIIIIIIVIILERIKVGPVTATIATSTA